MPLRNSLFARIADFQRDRGRLGRRHTAWDRRASRPRLELLEDRTLLSIVVVENSKDNGPGSLRDTIATAAAGDTIEFDLTPGHVTSPITLTSGELEITENLTIDGPGAGTLTISGDSNSRVFQVSGGVTATISGLTIKDGKAALSGGGIGNGGSLKLTDDVFTSNSATGAGGAIYNSAGSLFMTGCSVTGNKAADGDGGGIYVAAGMVTIQGSTIDNNNAGAQFGGGISNLGTLTVTNSTIANNSAADGGGIFNTFSSTLTATNSTICDNNSSVDGGGIFNFGSMTVTNSTIAGNSASQEGGGIVAINPGGIPVVVTFANTIIAGNSLIGPVAGEGPDFFGQVTNDLGYNLIGDASGSTGFTQPSDLLNVNPLLGPLQNNGGPTETVALLANSPAIDAGSNSIPGVTIPTTDQRGALRGPAGLNAGANVDIGAYEASSSYLVNTAADSNDVGTLRTAVGWANVSTNANPENISNPAPNTIVFDTSGVFSMPQTIALEPDLGTLMLNNSSIPESIVGPGAGVVAVSGNGASQVFQVDGGVTAAISGLTIDDGSAGTTNGGGIDNGGTLSLTNCTVSNSSSGDNGGGIDNQGTLTLTASTVSGNSATNNGGGIENAGTLMLVNSTIASNTADNGGGIENTAATPVAAGATMTSINSTIADNSAAGNGGGIDNGNGGSATLGNTIVAGNSSTGAGSGPDFGGTVTTDKGNNLIGDDSGSSGFAQPPDLLNVNPLLSLLGNYGGPTQTFALLPGSPAIDAGDNALIPAGITTDQRGLPRIVNGVVDIGAVESQGYTITVSSGNNQQADVNTNFASSLVVLVTANNVDDPVSGGVVTFTPPLSGASATFPGGSDTATINASGDASIGVAANTIAGSYSVSASATGATPTSFNLTNTPGAADKLVFVQQPTTTTYGNTISPAVTVEVEDQFNNLVNSTASITVTLQNNPTGATLLGSSVSAIGGIATFSDLTVSKVGTVYTLAATSTGLSDSPPSNSFNITPRPITVTAAANIKTYDGTTSASAMPTITSGGLASGDAPDFTEVYSTRNVGTGLTLTPSGTVIDGNGGNNYTYTFVPVSTGVITALALTITAVANTKTYDGTT
ncbi:MAG: choice-of-anchor Q domain-containing protein, partial [Isosphaeraceae bacterium]